MKPDPSIQEYTVSQIWAVFSKQGSKLLKIKNVSIFEKIVNIWVTVQNIFNQQFSIQ